MEWSPPLKPAELAESRVIEAILAGRFPIGSGLPPERELAAQLGVTRPTLREALQRLARDGWIEIHHGRSTRVRDYWREGSLAVLASIARHPGGGDPNFIPNLLQVRLLLAPTYARQAVERDAASVATHLAECLAADDDPAAYARADWDLHVTLTTHSGNPIFTLILNGFRDLYLDLGPTYFSARAARERSQLFYRDLLATARRGDGAAAEAVTRKVMEDSLAIWAAAGRDRSGEGGET